MRRKILTCSALGVFGVFSKAHINIPFTSAEMHTYVIERTPHILHTFWVMTELPTERVATSVASEKRGSPLILLLSGMGFSFNKTANNIYYFK